MENNWKKIFVGSNPIRVEIYRQILEESGIKSVIMNKQDSSYRFGNIELYVHEADEEKATEIISNTTIEDAPEDEESPE